MSYNFNTMDRNFYYRGLWVSISSTHEHNQIKILSDNPNHTFQPKVLASIVAPLNSHHPVFYFPEISTDRLQEIHLFQRAAEVAMELWGSFDLLVTTNHIPKGALLQPTLAA